MDLISTEYLPAGTWVMLNEDAPMDIQLLLGSEAVMRIFFQSGCDVATNGDGDLICNRRYAIFHQHRGRMFLDVPGAFLMQIDQDSAKGQVLLHGEMTRDLAKHMS